MAVREIVRIDEALCDGCGECVPACAEGAIAVVDGKARLVGEVLCDGLGACLGHCPQGAITIERREADAFDEAAVAAHLERQHTAPVVPTGCPSAAPRTVLPIAGGGACPGSASTVASGGLRQWPVQLHLIPPTAPFLQGADVVLAADCVAFASPRFHAEMLDGRALAIGCPKLDRDLHLYVDKLVAMIEHADIRSLEVVVMEVPCCGGLVRLADVARRTAFRDIPITVTTIGIDGEVRSRAVA
jgi:ferredoxin